MTPEKVLTLAEAVGRRFDTIFSQDDSIRSNPLSLKPPIAEAATKRTSIHDSPIRDLQSIVLSIEWEITDPLLLRFEREVTDLERTFCTNPIKVNFLKILQTLGRYIKTKKARAHPGSIKLMAATFRRFEQVVHNAEMPFVDQQKLLHKTIQEFRLLKKELAAEARPASQLETPVSPGQTQDHLIAIKASLEVSTPKVVPQDTTPQTSEAPEVGLESKNGPENTEMADVTPTVAEESAAARQTREIPKPMVEAPRFQPSDRENHMTPHEAFAVAVEELKCLIRAEFSALRAEIQMWRHGQ